MKSIIFAILCTIGSNASACMAKLMPDENFNKYSQIFIGEVTGIHLIDYEKKRLENLSKGGNQRWFSDITQPHDLTLVVTKNFIGKPDKLFKLRVDGCGVVIPNPRMLGIFFVDKEHDLVIPIYENEGEIYYNILLKLGKKYPKLSENS